MESWLLKLTFFFFCCLDILLFYFTNLWLPFPEAILTCKLSQLKRHFYFFTETSLSLSYNTLRHSGSGGQTLAVVSSDYEFKALGNLTMYVFF